MNNKRVYQRHPIELSASYNFSNDAARTEHAVTVNISGGGFCFSSPEPIDINRDLRLAVELNAKDYVMIDVIVVWCKKIGDSGKHQIGVRISNAQGPDFERFLDFYCKKVKQVSKET